MSLFATSTNFRGKNKKKPGTVKNETLKLATCPFSDAGGAPATEIQSNLQSFRALGRALLPGLLSSKQRLHGLQRATPGVDKKAPRKEARMPERWYCNPFRVHSLSEESSRRESSRTEGGME